MVALQGRRIQITADWVLRARGKMMKNKANGPADCLVTEMLQCSPLETVYEVTHWFEKRFRGECPAQKLAKFCAWCFSRNLTPSLRKDFRGLRAIALLSVFSEWYTTVLVDLLHEEKEPVEWKALHVGAERGVNSEHMQEAMLPNILQNHWEWQEDHPIHLQPALSRSNTAFMASLDVKTAFAVAKPSVVSKILTLTGVPGHLAAALLAEMQDVRGSACCENYETSGQVFEVYPPGWCGGSGILGTCGQICVVES